MTDFAFGVPQQWERRLCCVAWPTGTPPASLILFSQRDIEHEHELPDMCLDNAFICDAFFFGMLLRRMACSRS